MTADRVDLLMSCNSKVSVDEGRCLGENVERVSGECKTALVDQGWTYSSLMILRFIGFGIKREFDPAQCPARALFMYSPEASKLIDICCL